MKYLGLIWALWRNAPWREALVSTLYGLKLTAETPFKKADKDLARARLEACHRCLMFDHRYSSCGTPGAMNGGRPFGCWCYMPVGVYHRDKRCWMGANGLEDQWKFTT